MNILNLFKRKKNIEPIALEESDIFDNMTKHQLLRVKTRIEQELKDIELKEKELKLSNMPF